MVGLWLEIVSRLPTPPPPPPFNLKKRIYIYLLPVGSAESRINLGSYSDESPGNSEHEIILLREQGNDPWEDGLAGQLTLAILAHQTYNI